MFQREPLHWRPHNGLVHRTVARKSSKEELCGCAGGLALRKLKNTPLISVFHFPICRAWRFVWGDKPTKNPRGDGTASPPGHCDHKSKISKKPDVSSKVPIDSFLVITVYLNDSFAGFSSHSQVMFAL